MHHASVIAWPGACGSDFVSVPVFDKHEGVHERSRDSEGNHMP